MVLTPACTARSLSEGTADEIDRQQLNLLTKKNKARVKAIELFPMLQDALKRVKDSDRAEALLLTVWAEKQRIR